MHGGVLQELACCYFGSEHLRAEEVVVHAILLTGAGGAGGAGDGVGGEAVGLGTAAKRCFTRARRAGNDEECS